MAREKYEDKGTILEQAQHMISCSHFSPLSGLPDVPENYHTVSIELSPDKNATVVTLTQDNNPDEEARRHSEQNYDDAVKLKNLMEKVS